MREPPSPVRKSSIRRLTVTAKEASPKTARLIPHRLAPTSTSTTPRAATVSPRSSLTRTRGAAQATTIVQRRPRSGPCDRDHGQATTTACPTSRVTGVGNSRYNGAKSANTLTGGAADRRPGLVHHTSVLWWCSPGPAFGLGIGRTDESNPSRARRSALHLAVASTQRPDWSQTWLDCGSLPAWVMTHDAPRWATPVQSTNASH
jgi:hypothetical protein